MAAVVGELDAAAFEALVQLVRLLVVEAGLGDEVGELGQVHAALRLALRDEDVEARLDVGFDGHPSCGMAGSRGS